MSYSMHSPPAHQGHHYPNPAAAEVYAASSRAYASHLMSPAAAMSGYPGYLRNDDPYGSGGTGQYSNGLPPPPPTSAGLYSPAGANSPLSPNAHHAHHTYPPPPPHSSGGPMLNHFGGHQSPHDVYNPCVGPPPPPTTRNVPYPIPPPLPLRHTSSSSGKNSAASSTSSTSTPTSSSSAYWACDPQPPPPSNHCYQQPPPPQPLPSPAKVSQSWSRSPNVMAAHSPSSTPSPIPPCGPGTPSAHPYVSSPHHQPPPDTVVGKSNSSSSATSTSSFNGILPSSVVHGGHSTGGGAGSAMNCNSNPLQSLQKMVQIESESHQYDTSTSNSSNVVPMSHQMPNTAQPHPMTSGGGNLDGGGVPDATVTGTGAGNYPTYYNLDQNRLCATPGGGGGGGGYGSGTGSMPPSAAQSSPVAMHPSSFSPSSSSHMKTSPSDSGRSPGMKPEQPTNKANANDTGSDASLNHRSSMRFGSAKMGKISSSGGSCSTDTTCSNESPTQQSSTPNHTTSTTATANKSNLPESVMHTDQTHDSMNSFRGSETTANSRDSMKSSDSDAVSSSYAVSQCSTPNNSWSKANDFRSASNFSSANNQTPQQQQQSSKSWWSVDGGGGGSAAATGRSSFTPQAMSAECNQYPTNVNYSMTQLSSSSTPNSNNSNHGHPSPWSSSSAATTSANMTGGQPNSQLMSNYGTHPDGVVVKKKRGRPFGSKNRRSLETAAAAAAATASQQQQQQQHHHQHQQQLLLMDAAKRKRKTLLIDAGVNTSLSFDVRASWTCDDATTFATVMEANDGPGIQHPVPLGAKRKKIVGPVIRIDKSSSARCEPTMPSNGTSAARYSIVNNSHTAKINLESDEDEKESKPCFNDLKNNSYSKKFSFLSSNDTGNSNDNNKNWHCVLCRKGPHYKGLGDLYGPYLILLEKSKLDMVTTADSSNNLETAEPANENISGDATQQEQSAPPPPPPPEPEARRSLRKRPESATTTADGDKKMVNHHHNNQHNHHQHQHNHHHHQNNNSFETPSSSTATTANTGTKTEVEVWIHEDCIVWSNNVYLEGTKIRNLEPAIVESLENTCSKCKLPGATLGCIYKNCTVSPLHYLCAKEKDCDLDEEKFILSCSKHKKRRIMPPQSCNNKPQDDKRPNGDSMAAHRHHHHPTGETNSIITINNGDDHQ